MAANKSDAESIVLVVPTLNEPPTIKALLNTVPKTVDGLEATPLVIDG